MVAAIRNGLRCANVRKLWRSRTEVRWDFSPSATVAVLGAGHGGLALAGYLGKSGHRVALWNRSEARVEPVRRRGGVGLTMPGSAAHEVPIAIATSDMRVALRDARAIFVAVPASAHADVARACAPCLRDGQTVLLLPGRTGGALEFRRILTEADCRAEILLGEANSFPIAARNTGAAEAMIFGTKAELLAASLPSDRTAVLIAACRPFLPMLAPARSVLHTGLSNLGAILHPTIMLLNSHRIERGDVFDFYTEGVSAHVAEILARADLERIRVAKAYGETVQSLIEWIGTAYGHCADTTHMAVGGNPAYVGIKAPSTLNHRYLWEDVPTGLIPLLALSDAAGLDSPTLRSLVRLARMKLGGVRWQNPRTLASLGLAGCSTAEVRRVVSSGEYCNAAAVPFRQPLFAGILTGREVA